MDYTSKVSINRLRKVSLYLFLFTNIALFGTLFSQNFLTQHNISYVDYPQFSQTVEDIDCNKNNNFCYDAHLWKKESKILDQCAIYRNFETYHVDEIVVPGTVEEYKSLVFGKNKKIKPEYKNSNIFISFRSTDIKNKVCIKNYPIYYSIYKIFPKIPTLITDIKLDPNYFDATGKVVNPFFYGETSISNIAKRYPLYLIFKPFLYIASILMIAYWTYTKKVIFFFTKSDEIQLFYVFGILSGFCLFLHVLFLGSEIHNEIFVKLRRFFIVFFIFFELLAQLFLIKKLFSIKEIISNFIKQIVLQIKRFFVIFFIVLTMLLSSILIIFDITKEVNYIIEWNYFVILSFYYLLTFYLWKKN